MFKIYFCTCILALGISGASNIAKADVKIVYPFAGAQHPKAFPGPHSVDSYYLPISFSATCEGGPHNVRWSVTGEQLGSATFYDQFTAQFIFKVAAGSQEITVETDDPNKCGSEQIKIAIQG